MSPVRWSRRKSSSSESERNCYNVQTSQVTTERPLKKNKKKIHEERKRICEKRNPLLDRVKTTSLSFFKDREAKDDEIEEPEVTEKSQFRSMCELSHRGLTRNDFRRSICETDLKDLTEEEKTQAKRKRRSKSQSRLPFRKSDEHFSFLGFRNQHKESRNPNEEFSTRGWTTSKEFQEETKNPTDHRVQEIPASPNDVTFKSTAQFDSITPTSCLAAKFRAMQDKYLKNSTSKLIAKIYKKDGKDREKRRLRSFSYGTLPGLDELRTNPLYEEQDQDDNDSGILDNDSATSSLLDDRCSSGASGLLASPQLESPPQLPPRRPSGSMPDIERTTKLFSNLDVYCDKDRSSCSKDISRSNQLKEEKICQAANSELIGREIELDSRGKLSSTKVRLSRSLDRGKSLESLKLMREQVKLEKPSAALPVVRSKTCTIETMVVKLPRETPDQCLGIFIAKTTESSPGYLVAHVVPNGLADKEGTLRIGDEILIVNGRRLRGLSMAEARKILGNGSGPGEVDIVVSRYTGVDAPRKLKESSVDYENVSMENGHGTIVENSPRFRKNHSRNCRDRKNESNRSISSEKSNMDNSSTSSTSSQGISNFCTLPRRPRSTVSTFLTVVFEKGPGKKSLGFTIVGGRDSPKGSIGIFIKSVLPAGQAAEDGRLRAGDEILAVNGQVCHDLTHKEAVQLFRHIKNGSVALHLCRRIKNREPQVIKAKSCADLLLVDS
ncbi:pro-interleukin-16-like isoform X2 [Prorops nasuta]